MQVAQSEAVCVVDDYGIGVGYVDTVLHYRRGKQHIIVVIHESHEYLLQFVGVHLSVSDCHPCVGYIFFYESGYLLKI